MFEQRRWDGAGAGVALIRDGNGTRSFETVGGASPDLGGRCAPTNRYRNAAMAEFLRALRTLKALQAEQAAPELPVAAPTSVRAQPSRPVASPESAAILAPNEPEGRPVARRLDHLPPDPPVAGRALHEPAAPWLPNEPEAEGGARLNPA